MLLLQGQLFAQSDNLLQPQDIFNLEYVNNPAISPDGKTVIYERNYFDIITDRKYTNLWIVKADGSDNKPLTTGPHHDTQPFWSNDGEQLYFMSDMDGNMQIYKLWVQNGNIARLSNTVKTPRSMALSPDGKWLAFTMFVLEKKKPFAKLPGKPEGAEWNKPPVYIDELVYRRDGAGYVKPGNIQLFIISTEGGTAIQLTKGRNFLRGRPSWSHDSKALYFSANLHEDAEYQPANTELYRLDIATKKIEQLTDRFGPDHSPVVSPDGKTIAYLGYDDHHQAYQITRLHLYDVKTKKSKLITGRFDRSVRNLQWSKDGKGLWCLFDNEGNTKIGYVGLNGKVKAVAEHVGGTFLGRPYNSGGYAVSDHGDIAYTYSDGEHPAELVFVKHKGGEKKLFDPNTDLFAFKKTSKVEEIWYESSYDNRKIQGWIVKPPHFDPDKKYPLVLEIHGGPVANYGDRFSIEIQLYAAAGYVVLYTNPRGSTSYGEEFGNLIHHDYPNHDFEDLMSGVDAIFAKGYIDENRLFVTGGSGGGVLTAWIVGHTERFAAAVSAKPVINWTSEALTADIAILTTKYWFPGTPWEKPEEYLRRSPLSYVGNVKTPTMLLTGEQDFRTPISETEQFYTALKLQKVETAMVRIPGSSHGIAGRPSNLLAKVVYILKWFEIHDPGKKKSE